MERGVFGCRWWFFEDQIWWENMATVRDQFPLPKNESSHSWHSLCCYDSPRSTRRYGNAMEDHDLCQNWNGQLSALPRKNSPSSAFYSNVREREHMHVGTAGTCFWILLVGSVDYDWLRSNQIGFPHRYSPKWLSFAGLSLERKMLALIIWIIPSS